jgi:HK97 family phage portal protein
MDFFNNLFKKEIKLPILSTSVSQPRFSISGQTNDSGYLKEYKNWVFACVNARAEELAGIDLELYSGEKEIENHEVLDLLEDVNPNMTQYELFFGTQAFLDLTGNAYWYLARDKDGAGKIKQIYLLQADKMHIVPNKDNPLVIDGYVYVNGKDKIPFNPNEILHFKNFNPVGGYPNPHKGMGIIQASLWAIETDNEARTWNYSFFKNSAKPDGILSTEGTLTNEQYQRIKQQWAQNNGGSTKNGAIAITEGGLKWTETSKTQKDMDFVAQRTFSRDEIFTAFRVPKSVLGITEDVNRANAEASDYVFAKRTIKPLMKRFVNVLNEYLLPEYGSNLKFKFEDPTPEDRMAELQEYALGHNKWLTTNDIRLEEGLIPSDNGNEFYGAFSEVVRDTVPKSKPVKSAEPIAKGAEKVINDFIAKLPKKEVEKEVRRTSKAQKEVYKEVYLKRFDANEKDLIVQVQKYFKDQEKEVLKNAEQEFNGLKPKEYKMKGIEDVLFYMEDAVSLGISLITPNIRKYLEQGAEMGDSITGGNFVADTITERFIKDRAKFFATTINDTTSEALTKTITEALEAGEGVADIQRRISEVYTEAETYRTERIARTEVSASINEGNIQSYKQAGIEQVEWIAITDDRTSDECMANDGEIRTIGDEFPAGVTQPPTHVNCRCTTNPVLN